MIPCSVCGQRLYPLERMTLNSKVFHKNGCAKCTTCNTNLSVNNFAMVGDKLYCKTHYMSNFSRSGGRYSFSMDKSTASETSSILESSKPVASTRPSYAAPPQKSHQSVPVQSSAPAKVNKLAAFLATATKEDMAESPPATPIKRTVSSLSVESSKAAKIDQSSSQAKVTMPPKSAASSVSKPSGDNKLAAFLSQTTAGSTPEPRKTLVAEKPPAPIYTSSATTTISSSVKKQDSAVEAAPRPISLKERIALYSSEASKAKEAKVETLVVAPSLPTKDPSLQSMGKQSTVVESSRRASFEEPRVQSSTASSTQRRGSNHSTASSSSSSSTLTSKTTTSSTTNSQQSQSTNKLAAFLQTAESPSVGRVQQASSSSKAVASPPLPPNKPLSPVLQRQTSNLDEVSRDRPKSLKERIAAYSTEASKSSRSSSSSDFADDLSSSALPRPPPMATPSTNKSTTNRQPPDSALKGGMSLQERIAVYQTKASGRRSSAGKTGRRSLEPSSSPMKKSSFRSRLPSFLKSSTHVTPTSKPSELAKTLRKICEESVGQISRASIKDGDANQDVKAIALDMLDSFEKLLNRLDDIDDINIPV